MQWIPNLYQVTEFPDNVTRSPQVSFSPSKSIADPSRTERESQTVVRDGRLTFVTQQFFPSRIVSKCQLPGYSRYIYVLYFTSIGIINHRAIMTLRPGINYSRIGNRNLFKTLKQNSRKNFKDRTDSECKRVYFFFLLFSFVTYFL